MNENSGTPRHEEDREEVTVQKLLSGVSRWHRLARRSDLVRLASALVTGWARFENKKAGVHPGLNQAWSGQGGTAGYEFPGQAQEICTELLRQARDALAQGEINVGWECLQAFEREMVVALTEDELAAKLISTEAEAREKLERWRHGAAERLLSPEEHEEHEGGRGKESAGFLRRHPLPRPGPRFVNRARLKEAMYHLDQQSQNTYLKINRLRAQLSIVSLSVTSMVVAILGINAMKGFNFLHVGLHEQLPVAVLSGLLGGVLSVAYTVARSDPKRKIPEVKASFSVTLVRPIIGSAIALPVLFFFHSGLINLADGHRSWVVPTFCFVGGFSERWFLGIVGKLED